MSRRADEVRRIAGSSYWRAEEARVVVEAWRASGMSVATFARRYGIASQRISRWAHRLEDDAPSTHFHPVRVVELPVTEVARDESPAIEIIVREGVRIHVLPGTAPAHLRQVLEVVMERHRC